MKLNEDLVAEIIALLPLKKLIQCKILNKGFNYLISDPNFVRTHALSVPKTPDFLICTDTMFKKFTPIKKFHSKIVFPVEDTIILDSCNGLVLLDFTEFDTFCVFNPVTRMHQLIPAPMTVGRRLGACLASDYPASDQYKVVIVQTLVEEKGYKFHMFSSEDTVGEWQEFQLTTDLGNPAYFSKAAYLHGTLNWLMADGCVLTFDAKKKNARIVNNAAEAIKLLGGDIRYGNVIESRTWFGTANGKLHLVCALDKDVVVVANDDTTNSWEIAHITRNCFSYTKKLLPIWFDNKRVLFLVKGSIYQYDFGRNLGYPLVLMTEEFFQYNSFHPFVPTLAAVRRTLPDSVEDSKIAKITNALDRLKKLF